MKRAATVGLTAFAALAVAATPASASSGFRINSDGAAAHGGPCTGQEAAEAHAGVSPPVPCVSIDPPLETQGFYWVV